MGGMTKQQSQSILNHIVGTDEYNYNGVSKNYVALLTGDPTEDGLNKELTGTGYARQQVPMAAASGGVCSNTSDVVFPVAGSDWGVITHIGIYSQLVDGTVYFYAELPNPRHIKAGDQYKILATNLQMTVV